MTSLRVVANCSLALLLFLVRVNITYRGGDCGGGGGFLEVRSVLRHHRMRTEDSLSREETNDGMRRSYFRCLEHAEPAAVARDHAWGSLVGWI